MGSLRELKTEGKNVHLVYSPSSLAEMYVYDTLKGICNATLDSIYTITTRADFKVMIEYSNIQPYLSDKWLFVVEYSKLKALCKQQKAVFNSSTSYFIVKVKNYKEYKEFKEILPKCNDLYLALIRKNDVMYLLNDYGLSQKLVDFVATSYIRDPEKVFMLKEDLENGITVETQKDIVKRLGSSSGSIVKFVLSLLADPPNSERGSVMVYKRRIQMASDLIDAYGIRSFKNFVTATAKDIYDLKTLYNQGVIFKTIRDLPDKYDEKRLSKYNYCLGRIAEDIPYSRIIRLYCMLCESKRWQSESDMLEFMYRYYE